MPALEVFSQHKRLTISEQWTCGSCLWPYILEYSFANRCVLYCHLVVLNCVT